MADGDKQVASPKTQRQKMMGVRTFSICEGRNVLIAIDGSENSKDAFDYYISDGHIGGDRVIIFHVQQPPALPLFSMGGGFMMPSENWETRITDEANKGAKLIEQYTGICESEGIVNEGIVKMGKVGELLVEGAAEIKADHIIMGSRGTNKTRRTQLGSATDYVLHHCDVPVTIVPPSKTTRESMIEEETPAHTRGRKTSSTARIMQTLAEGAEEDEVEEIFACGSLGEDSMDSSNSGNREPTINGMHSMNHGMNSMNVDSVMVGANNTQGLNTQNLLEVLNTMMTH